MPDYLIIVRLPSGTGSERATKVRGEIPRTLIKFGEIKGLFNSTDNSAVGIFVRATEEPRNILASLVRNVGLDRDEHAAVIPMTGPLHAHGFNEASQWISTSVLSSLSRR